MMRLTAPHNVPATYRLGYVKSIVLFLIAGTIDIAQFVLSLTGFGEVISMILGFFADLLLPIIAFLMGVNYKGSKGLAKMLTVGSTSVIELVPFINDIPAYTLEVGSLILLTRSEDIEEAIQQDKARKKQEQATRRAAMIQAARIRQQQQELQRQIQAANDNEEEIAQAA